MTTSHAPAGVDLVRARAKMLAGEHRRMRASLIAHREAMGLTQAQVGELLGVSQQAINRFERYDSDPKLSTIRRYANAVGAIIEHRVTPDVGQSVIAAAKSPWESSGTITRGPAQAARWLERLQIDAMGSEYASAADSKRTDFALAG